MPVYEYACRDCSHRFDVRQGIRDEPLTVCPNCNGAIRRVIQPVGIVFKGSGFYKTDSRSSSEASVPAAERKSDTPAAPSSESTAPAATPTTTGSTAAASASSAGSGGSAPAVKPASDS